MKLFLSLITLAALSSCSSKHDLMSNKTFELTCEAMHGDLTRAGGEIEGGDEMAMVPMFYGIINPQLLYTELGEPGDGGEDSNSANPVRFALSETSPVEIVLQHQVNDEPAYFDDKIEIIIDRKTGKAKVKQYKWNFTGLNTTNRWILDEEKSFNLGCSYKTI